MSDCPNEDDGGLRQAAPPGTGTLLGNNSQTENTGTLPEEVCVCMYFRQICYVQKTMNTLNLTGESTNKKCKLKFTHV